MEYAEQTAESIRLYLTESAFNASHFTLLKKESVSFGDIHIQFGILGESHFIEYRVGEKYLTEICACTEARKLTPPILVSDFLPNIKALPVTTTLLPYSYSFTYAYTQWDEGEDRLKKLRQKSTDSNTHILTHIFPASDHHPLEAVTEIYLTLGEILSLQTVHTYPNEGVMVFTHNKLAH